VPLEEPAWWYVASGGGRLAARLLGPVADIYGAIAEARFRRQTPYRASVPVICVGNFTAGGTGKTPLTRFLVEHLLSLGERPACLTRGYGGRLAGPAWVDAARHQAGDVGDEPLLLAKSAPVMVSRDRAAGARAIEAAEPKATVIVMDDGLQNGAVAKDLTIAVVDAMRGMGNGHVIPAGPLRAPLGFQLSLVDCIVVNGAKPKDNGVESVFERLKRSFPGPVLRAEPQPQGDASAFKDASVVAYAGIANPDRFFRLLEAIGARIAHVERFADHHEISESEAALLLATARRLDATLVTTEKDMARLDGAGGKRGELRNQSRTLAIKTSFADRDAVRLNALLGAEIKMRKGGSGSAVRP
jgi:tetraacyldisaccharide 4'-kinase